MNPIELYYIVFKYLYSAPQQPWANRETEALLVRLVPRKETSFKKW